MAAKFGRGGVAPVLILGLGLCSCVLALVGPRFTFSCRFFNHAFLYLGLVAGLNFILQTTRTPAIYLNTRSYADFVPFLALYGGFAVLAIVATTERPWLGRFQGWAVLVGFLLTGGWILLHTPQPKIDTYAVHQESCAALLHGANPYAITVTNVYDAKTSAAYYPREFIIGDRLDFGYTYVPLTLLMSLPGYLLCGDHRWSMLVALAVTGMLLARMRPGPSRSSAEGGIASSVLSVASAAVFLTFSRMYQVVESSWTEIFMVVLLAGTCFAAVRRHRSLPWLFGLFLASKQHTLLFAPAALLLLDRPWGLRKIVVFYAKALIAVLIVTLPLALWNVHAFYHSAIWHHLKLMPRWDSISLPSLLHAMGWPQVPGLSFGAVVLVYVLAWFKAPHGPIGFAITVAAVAFTYFFCSKGFLNYYFFVYGALCCALATADGLAQAFFEPSCEE